MTPAVLVVVLLAVLGSAEAQTPPTPQSRPEALAPSAVLTDIAGLLDRQDWTGARTAVESALRTYPDDAALHNFAGVIDAESHASASAESHFQTAIRLAPNESSAYENLGRLYQERAASDPAARDKAIDVYRRLLAIDPSNVEGQYQSAFLLALAGKFADSRALVDRLPAEVRQQSHTLALTALDLAATGDGTAGGAVSALAAHPDLVADDVLALLPAIAHLKDDDAARGLLEALDRRGLATAGTLQRLGRIHLGHQRNTEARAVLERAAAAAPSDVSILVDLARAADRARDHEGALGYLAHARALAPDDASIHFLFGVVCVEMDLVAEAYDSLKKAVTLAPENPQVNYMMGAVAMHRHEPAESLPYFEKYIALMPNDPRGRFALGLARFTSGMLAEARSDFSVAVTNPETAAGAHYYLGRIARQENDLDTAQREVSSAVTLAPTLADGWAELGLVQTRLGNVQEAQRSLEKALAIDPDHYQANVNLGTLYAKTKDPRREAQAARIAALQEQRNIRAQDFLRVIEVVP